MDNFKCIKCGSVFKAQKYLDQHNRRKTPCGVVEGNNNNPNRCIYCNRTYSNKYNLAKHHKICNIKNGGVETLPDVNRVEEKLRIIEEEREKEREEQRKKEEETQKRFAELQSIFAAKLAELEEKLAKQPPQIVQTGPINNGTVNNNNINILMYPNPYHAPNVEYLMKHPEDVRAEVNQHGIRLPETLIVPIYFNKNHPENLAVHCIDEKKDEYYVYGKDGWEYADANKVAEVMRVVAYKTSIRMVDEHCTTPEQLNYGQQIKQYINAKDAETNRELTEIKKTVASRRDVSKRVLLTIAPEVGSQIVAKK